MKMIKTIIVLAATLLMGAFVLAPVLTTAQSTSAMSSWPDSAVVLLTPSQEPNLTTPIPASENPMGVAVLQMNNSSNQICYQVWVTGISNVTEAHIHMGAAGQEGPVVAWLFPSNTTAQANASFNSTNLPGNFTGLLAKGNITSSDLVGPLKNQSLSSLMSAIASNQTYVNVHTTQNPGGEIRAQITSANIWANSLAVPMTPLQEPSLTTPIKVENVSMNANMSNASMNASVSNLSSLMGKNLGPIPWGIALMANGTNGIHYAIWTFNIANVTMAHFHLGAMGVEGPVVAWLFPNVTATQPLNISSAQAGKMMNGKLVEGNVTAANLVGPLQNATLETLIGDMVNGSIYVNVHTTQNPGGEIRGQVDPMNLTCAMSAPMTNATSSTPMSNSSMSNSSSNQSSGTSGY